MTKRYFLSADQVKPIAEGYGACIASDSITVQGQKVGYMYREEPSPETSADSGWRFFSGLETQEYIDDPNHLCYYDINTIANYDAAIIPLLSAPIGSAFAKNDAGTFDAEEFPSEPET
jgi:hypothetical protein